jgi:type VI protein secretion system component Hcp
MPNTAYLKLTDKRGVNIAPGYADEKGYEGWITVISFATSGGPSAKVADVTVLKPVDYASLKLRKMKDKREDQPCNAVLDLISKDKVSETKYRYNMFNVYIYDIVAESRGVSSMRANETDVDAVTAAMRFYGGVEKVTFMCDRIAPPRLISETRPSDNWS